MSENTHEQQRIIDAFRKGENVLFTGPAGTGKSFVVKQLMKSRIVALTATTGIAAVNIGGITLHKWAGIGLGKLKKEKLLDWVLKFPKAVNRWKFTKTLIIDEVSMLSAELFDKLEYIARQLRRNNKPFGGLQLVLVGDFYQLPPINGKFCFKADAWNAVMGNNIIELTKIFRQTDNEFIHVLNKIRKGKVDGQVKKMIKSLSHNTLINEECSICMKPIEREDLKLLSCRHPFHIDCIQRWFIENQSCPFCRNTCIEPVQLHSTNQMVEHINLERLSKIDEPEHVYECSDTGNENMDKYCIALKKLVLKKGAQVILIKNMDDQLVNGSTGIVVDFDNNVPIVKFMDYEGNVQIPLHTFKYEDSDGKLLSSRDQIPLRLSWSLSIHKSQSMSIDYLAVDLFNCFEYGQAYVALSRARHPRGLQILDYRRSSIKVNPEVKKFFNLVNNQDGRVQD